MNVTRDPESILNGWLDEGPTELPGATRRAILAALPTTPQARRGQFAPWRFSLMNSTTRLAAAALVAVVAIGALAYLVAPRLGPGSTTLPPSVAPTVSPAATSATATVDRSQAAGYLVSVPATWRSQVREGSVYFSTSSPITSAQLFEGDVAAGAGAAYVIPEGGGGGGSVTLHGHDATELLAELNQSYTTFYSAAATNEHTATVDGEQAKVVEHQTKGPDLLFIDAVVVHGSRAYNLSMGAPTQNGAELRATFDEILASIRWAD
jgi:hypothetical protein